MRDAAGSLLLLAGVISASQLQAAEARQLREGGNLGENLVRMGVVSEEQLVEFYHRRLLVPRLDRSHFEHVPARVLALVPADMAAEFKVFPVELDVEGTLTLAMADPANAGVADEVAFFTNCFCQRAAAAESVIRTAIVRHYGARPEWATPATPPPTPSLSPPPAPVAVARSTPRPDRDEVALPGMTTELPAFGVTSPPPARMRRAESVMPVDAPDPPLPALHVARTRDEIARLLLDYLATMAPRTALFVVRQALLVGLDGRGAHLDVEGLRRVQIPTDQPSLFRDVLHSRLPYRGPLVETAVSRALVEQIGRAEGDVLVFPIVVRSKVVALLYADGLTRPLPDASLHAVASAAGSAYERLLRHSRP